MNKDQQYTNELSTRKNSLEVSLKYIDMTAERLLTTPDDEERALCLSFLEDVYKVTAQEVNSLNRELRQLYKKGFRPNNQN